MANMTKEEAYRAGYENPLMGDIGPLQRLYGTLGAIGAELGGGDMGTPFGQRFGERQKATKAEIKRLQELRAKFPEEFGQGMMQSTDVQDPYLLNQLVGTLGFMRPGVTTFSPVEGPQRIRQGAGVAAEAPRAAPGIGYAPRPVEPYYRNVPPEMGTSARPMSAYNQNMYGMSTGRYGPAGAQYAPEMAVTDSETYAPGGMGRTSPETWGRPLSKFDQNMYDAYVRGRAARGGGRPGPMGGDYTLEELGSAPVPYRQGGLVYEPVGQAPGGRNLPMMAQGRGMRPTMMEGEFTEVPPQGQIPYGMGYRPNFTMQGGTYTPSAGASPGMSMGQRMAQGAYNYAPTPTRPGMPYGVIAGTMGAGAAVPLMAEYGSTFDRPVSMLPQSTPLQGSSAPPAQALYGQPGPYDFATGIDFLSPKGDQYHNFINTPVTPLPTQQRKAQATGAQGKGEGKAPIIPLPPRKPEDMQGGQFEPNFNYLVTSAIDQLLGQGEAERGRNTQQYYATHPWPY